MQAGQGHVFDWWDDLTEEEKSNLLLQIGRLDLGLLRRVIQAYRTGKIEEDFAYLTPAESTMLEGEVLQRAQRLGERAIREGKVCSLVLAGGQGTRLGYSHPKGLYPIGPISGKSLFEWFAEKIRFISLQANASVPIPWLIMTSNATDAETRAFFRQKAFFGLGEDSVSLFEQGSLPSIDFQGKLLMDAKHHVCENPDGHGGVVEALGKSGLLARMARQGIQHLFVHNVDNCLVKVCDPAFLGHHIYTEADFSCKSLVKRSPDEELGTIVNANSRIRIIEYSDTPEEIANWRDEEGQLVYGNGSINTYLVRIDLLKRVYDEKCSLPIHVARKRIPTLDSSGNVHSPQHANGLKLETKIFDLLQHAEKAAVLSADRREEYSPLKNMQGQDSYTTVLRDLQALFSGWIEQTGGIRIRDREVGPIEISPSFATDLDTFRDKVATIGQRAFAEMIEQQVKDKGCISL